MDTRQFHQVYLIKRERVSLKKISVTVDFYVPSIICDEAIISTEKDNQFTYIFTIQKGKFEPDTLFMFDRDFHDKNLVKIDEEDTSGIIIHGREEEIVAWLRKQAEEDAEQRKEFAKEAEEKNLEVEIPKKFKKEFAITNNKTTYAIKNCYICGVDYGYNKIEVIAKNA